MLLQLIPQLRSTANYNRPLIIFNILSLDITVSWRSHLHRLYFAWHIGIKHINYASRILSPPFLSLSLSLAFRDFTFAHISEDREKRQPMILIC